MKEFVRPECLSCLYVLSVCAHPDCVSVLFARPECVSVLFARPECVSVLFARPECVSVLRPSTVHGKQDGKIQPV